MKIIRCDVCEKEFSEDQEMIAAYIPCSFLIPEGDSLGLTVDVCSFSCLSSMSVDYGAEKDDKPQQVEAEPIGITREQSELMTGVKMKY